MKRRARSWAIVVAAVLWLPTVGRAADPDQDFIAKLVSRSFFRALLDGEIETALPLCAERVNLDGEIVASKEALTQHLKQMSRRARRLGIRMKKLQVLSVRDAIQRFGPPPSRLKLRAGSFGTRVVLARFNNRGAVAVVRKTGAFWRIVALSD